MGKLTAQGYSINSLETWKQMFQEVFVGALGNDLILDDNSPQGVLINRLAQLAYNCDMDGLNAYLQQSINTAEGINLDAIAFLRGTKRKEGTTKQIVCECTTTAQPINLLANTKFVALESNIEYYLPSATMLTLPTQNITLYASEKGTDPITIGDLFQSLSFIPNLTNIEVVSYTDAQDTETDAELRKRLLNLTDDFVYTVRAVLSQLLTLEGVTKVSYLQHEDDNTVPTNSTEFMAVGGDNNAIAVKILDYKCPTSLTYGNTTVNLADYYGRARTVYFTRPTMCQITIDATIEKKEEQITIDITHNDEIKQRIVEYINEQDIGTDISYTTIYGIFASYNAFDISSLTLQKDSDPAVSTNITMNSREYGHITADDITITIQ